MSAVVQSTAQSHRSTHYSPISEATGISNTPVLPKQSPVPLMASVHPRHPSHSTSTASPPAASSTTGSSEGDASPASTMPLSPPANASAGNAENSQLPRPVTLPPRAKPGRKPATDTPVSKRKAQNREAQRNFRDRKRQRENEIQEQVRKREQEHLHYIRRIQEKHEKEMKQIREQTHAAREQERLQIESQLSEQNSALEMQRRRNEELNAQLQELMKQQNSTSASGSEVMQAVPLRRSNVNKKTPARGPALQRTELKPSDSSMKNNNNHNHAGGNTDTGAQKVPIEAEQQDADDAMEVDFTNMGKQESSNPGPFAPFDTDDSCGFCQANTYCACREQMLASNMPVQRTDAPVPPPKAMEPAAAPVGPGGCQACLDDPERRRICLAMASRRQEATTSSTEPGPSRSESLTSTSGPHHPGDASKRLPDPVPSFGVNGTGNPWKDSHMTCADAITYGRRNDPNFRENWFKPEFLDRLRVTEPHAGHTAQSAQDVEIASIMAAMSASSSRNDSSLSTPLSKTVPRSDDNEEDDDDD